MLGYMMKLQSDSSMKSMYESVHAKLYNILTIVSGFCQPFDIGNIAQTSMYTLPMCRSYRQQYSLIKQVNQKP